MTKDGGQERGTKTITRVCAWCHPERKDDPTVSHGLCEEHYRELMIKAGLDPDEPENEKTR